jgi:C-terminal processing protease CtpA/Prc
LGAWLIFVTSKKEETAMNVRLCTIPIAICLLVLSFYSPAQEPAVTTTHYEHALKKFFDDVDMYYPFFDVKRIRDDWDACKKRLLAEVTSCKSNSEFYGLLIKAAKCMRDGHFGFEELRGKLPPFPLRYYPGIAFIPATNNRVVVMSSPRDLMKKLPSGTVVTKIDGRDAREALEEAAVASWKAGGGFSSPQRAGVFAWRQALAGRKGATHELAFIMDGKETEITVESKWQTRGWPHVYAMPKGLKRSGNARYCVLPSGYGYIYLRRIKPDLVQSIDEALTSFASVKGLIIDLRGNGGGGYNREVFNRFNKKGFAMRGIPFCQGEMAVLIDAGTVSAGETFARDLVNIANARIFGSTSAGSSSVKRHYQLAHGLGKVRYSIRSRGGLNGKRIEYHGIAPHEYVEVVPEELLAGINSGICCAEEYLDKKRAETEDDLPAVVVPRKRKVTPETSKSK